ncbi:MAG: alpha/beta fold hydrolase [Gammaproteobacteria bacterium]
MSYVDVIEKVAVPKPDRYYTPPQFLEVQGIPLAYRRAGTGEPVLFLHGAGYTRRWIPLYEAMAQKVDFIAPEIPGFGETPAPKWFRTFDDLTLLLDEFLDRLRLDRIHLVGYSMGGWAAAEFATFYPRRLKSLSLLTPIGLRLPDNPGVDLFQLSPAELMDRLFNDKAVQQDFTPDPNDFDEGIHLYSEFAAAARLIWAPRYNIALERRLQRVTCPNLVVRAEHDRLIPDEMAERFAQVLPDCRLEKIAETGHELCLERPAPLAAALIRHVTEAAR